MIAVKGVYENGIIKLTEPAPSMSKDVLVIFPDDEIENKSAKDFAQEFIRKHSKVMEELAK